jgi:hypothetical protein
MTLGTIIITHACNGFLSMKSQKIGTIVRYKRVVLGADCGHEFPVFGTAETELIDMMRHVTRRMRYSN